jgi:hypothetical protein
VPGRFPLLTDENVPGPVIEGLKAAGWEVVLTVDAFGQRSVDRVLFSHAAEQGYVMVTTDTDCLAIAKEWSAAGRRFKLIYWHQGRHQKLRVGRFVEAFDRLAAQESPFAACIEYLKIEG